MPIKEAEYYKPRMSVQPVGFALAIPVLIAVGVGLGFVLGEIANHASGYLKFKFIVLPMAMGVLPGVLAGYLIVKIGKMRHPAWGSVMGLLIGGVAGYAFMVARLWAMSDHEFMPKTPGQIRAMHSVIRENLAIRERYGANNVRDATESERTGFDFEVFGPAALALVVSVIAAPITVHFQPAICPSCGRLLRDPVFTRRFEFPRSTDRIQYSLEKGSLDELLQLRPLPDDAPLPLVEAGIIACDTCWEEPKYLTVVSVYNDTSTGKDQLMKARLIRLMRLDEAMEKRLREPPPATAGPNPDRGETST